MGIALGGALGAKTGLLVYADGDIPGLLRRVGLADRDRTAALMRRLYPGWEIEECEGSTLWDGVYPRGERPTRPAGPAWKSSAIRG